MKKVTIYFSQTGHRSSLIARALHQGASQLEGIDAAIVPANHYRGRPDSDVALFYGLAGGCRRIFEEYRASRKAVYIDLGYFGRRKRTRYDGYHKMVLNNRHPTAYFQAHRHSPERFESFGIPIQPWREEGKHILVVGMSAKAAVAEGLRAEAWERETIAKLRRITRRPIVYRPKPNWLGAKRIDGAAFERDQTLAEAFRDCHAVVARHSNVAVDALLAGIPCVCPHGVASVLSAHSLGELESLPMPKGRAQWAADLAHTQYSVSEMEDGTAWRYLLDERLI